ncbi:hypothetical protein C8R41DRAFT_871132 [Lentinula lateritia]|uniref:Proteophosphoglycan ppg4 n=1 Tax=Lentinula lateritia TaxID=40482 RepID=A0ABQ8V0U7_9AGAR|nr:hypothetical protein C8R41DRAFT_871132 [Lentinula lateritia]
MTSVSSFLKRSARSRARKSSPLQLSTTDLHIIPEEDETSRPSCSSSTSTSTSNTPELKRRRPISPYEIRIAKTQNHDSDEDFAYNSDLLSAPRPAPRPPCGVSPSSSPDSFCLTFTEESFKFPHPPLPTPSSDRHFFAQSPLSSPSSDSSALPPTPTSSDDEFPRPPPPKFVARRVSIRPLMIVKHDALPSMFSKSPSNFSEAEFSPSEESEPESDSEWYGRELSQMITLRSALPPNFPHTVKTESARPDSMVGSVYCGSSPASSFSSTLPSPQLNPTSSRRRFTIPSRSPPPPPRESVVPSPAVSEDDDFFTQVGKSEASRRPPPRTSIPADFGFFPEDVGEAAFAGDEEDDEDDCDNILTYYVEAESSALSGSSDSFYSQPSHTERFSISDLDGEFQFAIDTEIDRPMMLPLSLPNSPIDLESDIANGLAELRMRPEADAPVDEMADDLPILTNPSTSVTRSASLLARRQMRRNMTVSVPLAIDWNLSEEEEIAADEARDEIAVQNAVHSAPVASTAVRSPEEAPPAEDDEPSYEDHELRLKHSNPQLRSRWSSSTLSSIREEQQNRGWRSSKLRLYFSSSKKRSTSTSTGLLSPTTPTTPSKPKVDSKQKARNKKRAVVVVGPPSSASASSGWSYGSSLQSPVPKIPASTSTTGPMSPYYNYENRSPVSKRHRQTESDDVMVIGYGHHSGAHGAVGVRRRGSTSTSCSSARGSGASDASSILSGSSSASSGLRRKPIPVEMFLRA